MPADLVEADYWTFAQRWLSEEATVDLLARKFVVSAPAMRFRLLNLALIDPA